MKIPRDLKPGDRLWYSKTEYAEVMARAGDSYYFNDDADDVARGRICASSPRGVMNYWCDTGEEYAGDTPPITRIERITSASAKPDALAALKAMPYDMKLAADMDRTKPGADEAAVEAAIEWLNTIDQDDDDYKSLSLIRDYISTLRANDASTEDLEAIHDQVVGACYKELERAGIDEQPNGDGQPDYLLPAIVEHTLNLLSDKNENKIATLRRECEHLTAQVEDMTPRDLTETMIKNRDEAIGRADRLAARVAELEAKLTITQQDRAEQQRVAMECEQGRDRALDELAAVKRERDDSYGVLQNINTEVQRVIGERNKALDDLAAATERAEKAEALAAMRLAGYNDLEAVYSKSVGEHAAQRDAARADADALASILTHRPRDLDARFPVFAQIITTALAAHDAARKGA